MTHSTNFFSSTTLNLVLNRNLNLIADNINSYGKLKKINPKKFIFIKIWVNYDNHTLLNETDWVGTNTRDMKKEKHRVRK